MRSGILVCLSVIVLCACGVAAEQPPQVSPGDILIVANGDPNEAIPPAGTDPNKTWDPAKRLVAGWESISVSMTSQLYNPAVRPEAQPQEAQWSLVLSAFVDVLDHTGLIGWSRTSMSAVAYDQDGAVVSRTTPRTSAVRWYQQPMSLNLPPQFPGEMHVNRFPLSLPMEPDAVYPEVLSRVEWTLDVLVVDETTAFDFPFEPNETWVELTPGLEVKVEQATTAEGSYQYCLQTRYDRTKVAYVLGGSVNLWHDEMPPAVAVLKTDVLNAEGQSIRDLGGGGFGMSSSGSGSNDAITATLTGTGSCTACGTAATIRFTLAFGMYEQQIGFVLENVPVPAF